MDVNLNVQASYDADEGCFVSERMKHLATILHDYNPTLELRWIRPHLRETEEDRKKPYVIIHTLNGLEYPVLHFGEHEQPEHILEKVFLADMARHDVHDELSKRNAAVRAKQLFDFQDQMAEKRDFGQWLLETRNPYPVIKDKDTGELVKLDSQLRRVGRVRKTM